MLGKMLVHGLAAAVLIGSAAAVYAQARDNGYLSPVPPVAADRAKGGDRGDAEKRTGYIQPDGGKVSPGDGTREHSGKGERHRKHRDHDDDDD